MIPQDFIQVLFADMEARVGFDMYELDDDVIEEWITDWATMLNEFVMGKEVTPMYYIGNPN